MFNKFDEKREGVLNRQIRLLVGVTGSVATVKLRKLIVQLDECNYDIKVVATKAAMNFIHREEISVPLLTDDDEWSTWRELKDPVLHIQLRNWADVFLIAPLDANTLAKMANGICDNLLTCILRAWDTNKRIFACPAMNTYMWEHPITSRQLQGVVNDFHSLVIVNPTSKVLACGDEGLGAMAETEDIVKLLRTYLPD